MANAASDTAAAMDAELTAFLAPFLRTEGPRYRSADWLLSDFDDSVWNLKCDTEFRIDWRVEINDTGLLTSPRHALLWEVLRSWMIVQTHVDLTGGKQYAPESQKGRLLRVIHCIDYMLINALALGLGKHGLGALTGNDLYAMVAAIASSRSISDTIYQWPERLTAFLRTQIAGLSAEAIESALQDEPRLNQSIPDDDNRLTGLSPEEVVKARAWLWLRGGYSGSGDEFLFSPKTRLLAESIYQSTLWGKKTVMPLPTELCISEGHRFAREYRRARVTSDRDERLSTKSLNRYVVAITSLGLLNAEGLPAPALQHNDIKALTTSFDLKSEGRFRTLPHEVVFVALRRAIEFSLAHGDALIDSYLSLVRSALARNQTVMIFAWSNDIRPLLTDDARALGVERWSIEAPNTGTQGGNKSLDKPAYFAALRANEGLYECLRVLFGAIQITVGTLMARRQGELEDLVAGHCLDRSRTRLVFANRKSGLMGMRQLEARPIPPVAVRLIDMLHHLQASLIDMGVLASTTELFAYPARLGDIRLVSISPSNYNHSLDWFCDWAEMPLDRKGRRYYIRQHQLRRFFAMLFFWGGGFGGMDTLRWFMGHTDAQHLWHYITEFTPGATLRSVAAQWAAYGVKHATKEAELLGAELTEHFGINDFSVLEEEALQFYLEDLIEEGRLTIEPQFLDSGREYRIAVILRSKGEAG